MQRQPHDSDRDDYGYHNGEGTMGGSNYTTAPGPKHSLPQDWINAMNGAGSTESIWAYPYHSTQRDAEDHAAHAFAKLPPERQHELLNPPQQQETPTPEKFIRRRRGRSRAT